MQKILDKIKEGMVWASSKGIPLPLIRGHKQEGGSVSLTTLVISYVLCVLCVLDVVPAEHFEHAFELFVASSGLYFGRNFQKGKLSVAKAEKEQKETK